MVSSFLKMSSGLTEKLSSGEARPKYMMVAPLPASFTASAWVWTFPTHSITTSTLGQHSRRMPSVSSQRGSITLVAPRARAVSRLDWAGSVRITTEAPAFLASCIMIRPMGPAPITSTEEPGRIWHRSIPWIQQERGSVMAASSRSTPSGIL